MARKIIAILLVLLVCVPMYLPAMAAENIQGAEKDEELEPQGIVILPTTPEDPGGTLALLFSMHAAKV